MELVFFQFPTIRDLWKFRVEVNSLMFEINFLHLTLICECTDADLDLAVKKYKAKVITKESDCTQPSSFSSSFH
jgi:hypothetical protein